MKKLNYLLCFFLSGLVAFAQSPTPTLNSVSSYSPRIATINAADLNNTENASIQVQYLDGSGQPMQAVHYKASPNQKDVVSGFHTLDALGRPQKAYLSVPTSQAIGAFQSTVPSLASSFYGDTKPYSEVTTYQASPLSVPLASVGPGQSFNNKTTTQSYKTAGAGIRKYMYRPNTEADVDGFFVNGDLIKTSSTDEDGNEIMEFKDGVSGKLYESHQKEKGSSAVLITTYIYDQLGRPKYVLPPKATLAAQANIGSGKLFDQNDAIFQEGIYGVNYNQWGQAAETHKPGGGWTYTLYNELEAAVWSQDARQRSSNLWVWVKTDGHGRTVLSGTITNSSSRASLQNTFWNAGAALQFEEPSTASGNLYGYTNSSFPSGLNPTAADVQAVYYYDNYDWLTPLSNSSSLNFSFYKTAQWTNAKGLATGSRVKRLDTGALLTSVSYYDDKNRVIQTKTENRFGAINQTDFVYNFPGELLEERIIYRKPGQADMEVKTIYERDHVGRVLGAVHYLNGKSTPLAQYKYDELGRLNQKNLMAAAYDIITEDDAQPNGNQDLANRYVLLEPGTISAANGTYLACVIPEALQRMDYTYDIRGNLRGINTDANGNISLQDGDVFGMKLDHHETGQTYNGKVAKQTWQTASGSRSYTYGYDGYDRLNAANYTGQGSENYSVSGIGYDNNGNIAGLQRNGFNGSSWGQIDNLNYNYANPNYENKLNYVQDFANTTKGFKDNGGTGADYTYYPDGSLKSDANKGISLIEYNFLGLPTKISFGASIRIENTYDAEGLKLSQKLVNGSTTVQTDYMGGLIYQDGVLESISHDEGRIKVVNGVLNDPKYQFFLTDHLGNTRAIVERINETTALVQEVHYYPYGAVMEGVGLAGDWSRKLYQGNELITFNGYDNYDFNLRQYDPYLGRFNSIDPVDFASQGGYNAMLNNPLTYTDPNGDCPNCIAGGVGAIIGGVANLGIKLWRGQIHSFKDGAAAFGIGAVAGFVTGFTGGAAAGAFGLSAASITGGAVAGAAGSATGGLVQGLGNSAYFGDPYSAKDWATGIGIGALTGGIGGGVAARIKGGPNTNLWWGTPKGPDKSIWSFNNSATGAKGSISLGELEFAGVDDYVLNAEGAAIRGETPILGQSNTFAGQTANPQLFLPNASSYAQHHIFPQQFRNWFIQRGISNIDDYTVQVSTNTHLKGIHGNGLGNLPGKWNNQWNNFIKSNPNASPSEIFHFGEGLLQRYGLEYLPYKIYKR